MAVTLILKIFCLFLYQLLTFTYRMLQVITGVLKALAHQFHLSRQISMVTRVMHLGQILALMSSMLQVLQLLILLQFAHLLQLI
ncbi:MAG: hypothetical protein EBU07_18525 [Betaproteobacteria bacterium]|nr:hypothetical protein [Betaproteobacteria bacterium]